MAPFLLVTYCCSCHVYSVRDKLVLPADLSCWSSLLSSRSKGRFDMLATITVQEVAHRRSILNELYPGEPELPTRLDAVVLAMLTTFGESNTLWQQVSTSSTELYYIESSVPQFKMSYDNHVLHLDTSERDSMQKAFPELERTWEEARRRVGAIRGAHCH